MSSPSSPTREPAPAPARAYFDRPYFTVNCALPSVFALVMKPTSAGVASAGTSSFSTFSAWTVKTYRCGFPGGGQAPR